MASTVPHSPPETPFKNTQVDDLLVPGAQHQELEDQDTDEELSQSSTSPSNSLSLGGDSVRKETQDQMGEAIQVPSTPEPAHQDLTAKVEPSQSQRQQLFPNLTQLNRSTNLDNPQNRSRSVSPLKQPSSSARLGRAQNNPKLGSSRQIAGQNVGFEPALNQQNQNFQRQGQKEIIAKNNANQDEDTTDHELGVFDYDKIRDDYTQEMQEVNAEEETIRKEFDDYTQLFALWSTGGADRDDTRASKRLRTRERYVQLSEHSLEDKKKHHANVVGAFEAALKLLRGTQSTHFIT
ncbi:hypothetical protein BJ875DRAFT_472951 [Amylocarpus encephaloides]|uniref:Uncharacterized protein n=1 Tax=Amylocarpus encephaloides TaxID=45428 RepID=A0A9P8C1P9_9HELO|nr:hypothetical protein BJ875DRAFT_472951 [Amylocarpus encephaloides]